MSVGRKAASTASARRERVEKGNGRAPRACLQRDTDTLPSWAGVAGPSRTPGLGTAVFPPQHSPRPFHGFHSGLWQHLREAAVLS